MMSVLCGARCRIHAQYLSEELELNINSQGTILAERYAGRELGQGCDRALHRTGVGTQIAEGKEHKEFNGETFILEEGIFADLSIVKAWKADTTGNAIFRKTARNFNPPAAKMRARLRAGGGGESSNQGTLDPDAIHLPGIYVHRLIQGEHEKRIEQRTTRAA